MTQVDFYILHRRPSVQDKYQFTCQLLHKAWQQQQRLYVHFASAQAASYFDELLWTFQQDSFVPHALTHRPQQVASLDSQAMPTPIYLGYVPDTPVLLDVLVNLSDSIPSFYEQFPRVLEIIEDAPQVKQWGRQRYQIYRDAGHEMVLRDIGKKPN